MESKGKQDPLIRQKPEMLAALRERAIIQSVESSKRIASSLTFSASILSATATGACPGC